MAGVRSIQLWPNFLDPIWTESGLLQGEAHFVGGVEARDSSKGRPANATACHRWD